MVAIASFLITLFQSLALASDSSLSQCTGEVESEDNVIQVCLVQDATAPTLLVRRYLGSGETEEEKIPLTNLKLDQTKKGDLVTFLVAKSLGDEELIRAKNFVRSPTAITK